jgi:hypothetical protein
MELSQVTFLAFAVFNSLRVVSYLPQIARVAADTNGASAISYATWGLWTTAHIATGFYAAINIHDPYLLGVSIVNAICCFVVIVLTTVKRRALSCAQSLTAAPCLERVSSSFPPPARSASAGRRSRAPIRSTG